MTPTAAIRRRRRRRRSSTTSCARAVGRARRRPRQPRSTPRRASSRSVRRSRTCYAEVVKFPVAVALVTLAAASGCWSGDYLAKQGVGQLKLLRARRRIDDVLHDPSVSAETKRRLTLAPRCARVRRRRARAARRRRVHALRRFARRADRVERHRREEGQARGAPQSLPHRRRDSRISASSRSDDAKREAARLRAEDLDVYVRPVAGYSTLGITSDPIYSSMLDGSDARIVEVVLHEMTHATVYLPGHSEWNESLATVVGNEGAAQFFAARGDTSKVAALVGESRQRERDEEAFSRFLAPLVSSLQSLYAEAALSRSASSRGREQIFADARAKFLVALPAAAGQKTGRVRRRPAQQRGGAVVQRLPLDDAAASRAAAPARRQLARVRRAVQARRRGQARSAGVSRLRAREVK